MAVLSTLHAPSPRLILIMMLSSCERSLFYFTLDVGSMSSICIELELIVIHTF